MRRAGEEKESLRDCHRRHGRTHLPHSQAGAPLDLLSRRRFKRQATTHTGAGLGDGSAGTGAHL